MNTLTDLYQFPVSSKYEDKRFFISETIFCLLDFRILYFCIALVYVCIELDRFFNSIRLDPYTYLNNICMHLRGKFTYKWKKNDFFANIK